MPYTKAPSFIGHHHHKLLLWQKSSTRANQAKVEAHLPPDGQKNVKTKLPPSELYHREQKKKTEEEYTKKRCKWFPFLSLVLDSNQADRRVELTQVSLIQSPKLNCLPPPSSQNPRHATGLTDL